LAKKLRGEKMAGDLMLIPSEIIDKIAVKDIIKCNKTSSEYGLSLNPKQAQELVNTHQQALENNGRIEFTGGTIQKIIKCFCSSPFISKYNYADTLNDLVEIFYYFKNETDDEISDDELIILMRKYFNENCKGSLELLQGRELETLAHNIRYGIRDFMNLHQDSISEQGENDE